MIHYLLMKSLRLYKRRLRERERVHHMFEEAEQRLDLIIAYGIEDKNSLAFRGSGSPFVSGYSDECKQGVRSMQRESL
ncbi:hypothetical protein ES288_A04G047000v1 [Gossypium darwinii]|uniref:Uncharacterized protein n=1 Tax=Gossypium darwinii TaxID=34276 RepID=A0A5D2GW18_GOSDA|nr:hypothetical protein ES288_A04G047000v1 [Gossypium darwinii]